ncbi:hypothetical protein AA18889_2038 [Acetobacter senegalensis DSM 18889]|nr:hypothetical protein AA18889_2038 [Acetobacter senegalensis DSM 18889]
MLSGRQNSRSITLRPPAMRPNSLARAVLTPGRLSSGASKGARAELPSCPGTEEDVKERGLDTSDTQASVWQADRQV